MNHRHISQVDILLIFSQLYLDMLDMFPNLGHGEPAVETDGGGLRQVDGSEQPLPHFEHLLPHLEHTLIHLLAELGRPHLEGYLKGSGRHPK